MKTIALKRLSFALAAVSIATCAFAQETNNLPPQNNQPAQNLPERIINRLTAQQFVTDAALGGMKEVQASQLAIEKPQSPKVKNFAIHMVRDHSAANAKLAEIA